MLFQKECQSCALLRDMLRDERMDKANLMRLFLEHLEKVELKSPIVVPAETSVENYEQANRQSSYPSAKRALLEMQSRAKLKDVLESNQADRTLSIENLEAALELK